MTDKHAHTHLVDLGLAVTDLEDLGMVLTFYFLEAVFNRVPLLGGLHLFFYSLTLIQRERWSDRTNRYCNKLGREAKTG